MSHAMAAQAGIGAHGLWSVSRGLARGLSDPGEYKRMLDDADSPRRGDTDGRGNLSQEALIDFVTWFCNVALDQIRFMTSLFDLDHLDERIQRYVEQTLALPKGASEICSAILRRGEIPRGEAVTIPGRSERSGRSLLAKLVDAGLLVSETPKGAVRLCFTIDTADQLFPRLFPAQT
jgi:Fic family protein